MKKDVKIWHVIAILAVVGSGIVTIASGGFGIIPDYPAVKDVHHNTHDDNIAEIVVSSCSFIEEEKSAQGARYAQHDNSVIPAARESSSYPASRVSYSKLPSVTDKEANRMTEPNAILLDVRTPDESIPEQPNFMSGEDIICADDISEISNPNTDCPPYDRGVQSYRSKKESRFNKSGTATWLNITSDATSISFMDVYTDYGIDTDGDGKYDYLAIDVRVDVKKVGKYRIEGNLKDHNTGDYIVGAFTYRILDVGVQDVTLKFNGYQIYRHGISVKFDLEDLKLYDKDWNMLDYRGYAYTTSYYSYTYFDVPPADLTGSYSNYGIDTDSDGKYNYLAIDVWVNVKKEGYYSLRGWLDEDGNKFITYASTGSHLNEGLQKVTLKFNGYEIYRRGINAQFVLGLVELQVRSDDDWNIVDQKWDAHTTSFYYYTGFDKPPADITGSYSHYGIDADGDGKYDYLALDVWVNVKEAGYHNLQGWLEDCYGYYITSDSNRTYLKEGLQKLTLEFNGYEIYRHGVSGSLSLGHVKLLDYGWNVIEEKWDVYSTSYYAYTNFDTPPIDLTGAYVDYSVDIDGNGKYDYLAIDVGVNVKEAGTYTVTGNVYDNENEYITYGWAEAELSPGLQKLTLKFDGYMIYRNGVDGPFNLGCVALSDKWNRADYKYDAYITSYYNYTEFDRKFIGNFDDYGVDTDEDGLYNYLAVEAEINVTKAGEYKLSGNLQPSGYTEEGYPWPEIDSDGNRTYLEVGIQSITLQFDGTQIYNTKYSGSFRVWLSLYGIEKGNWIDGMEYYTNDYDYTDYQKPAAEFAQGFTDYGLDTDGNSLYDYLVIEKEILVRETGNYRLRGWLKSTSGETLDYNYNNTYLDVGLQSIKLQFDGLSIHLSGVSGKFDVNMDLYDQDSGEKLESTTNTTSYYSYTDFERPPAEFAPGFNDYGLDTGRNSLYDYLVIEKEIIVREAGNYQLSGSLKSPLGEGIDSDSNYTYLEVGLQSIKLRFYGPSIYTSGESGNFVVDIDLYNTDDWRWLDSTTNATSYYSYTDFERPPAEFTGNFNDYGLDTDEDTLYNYLVIESEINVTKAGGYELGGNLRYYDENGGYWDIDGDWNRTYLEADINEITLRFDGWRIYNLGYNGSFRAELQLYTVEEREKIDEADYLTANYNYTDFDPVMPPAIVSLTVNPNMNINKDNPAMINTTIIGDCLREITLFSGERVKSNENTNTYELRSIEWIPIDEWFFVGNNTYNITEEWNATTISFTEDGYYIGCYYATDDINETYPLICELPAEYNVLNRTIYYSQLGLFLYNGTWYPAVTYYFSDTEKVELVYVSQDQVFLNTTDPELIEEFPDAKSLDPNSKCKFMNLLIITDSNGTIIEDPFRHGEETRESKEFRIGDLMIKKNTSLPAGEYLIGMNVEDEVGNRAINGTIVFTAGISKVFDTGPGAYLSIFGTHNGTIIPSYDINVRTLYTYSCPGTGGHTESIELYENGELIAYGTWNGYKGDWHNITIHNVTGASYVTLLEDHEYNYVIITGSYPQIIHESSKEVTGGAINCAEFVDTNGKRYENWIPAIRLWSC
jgi:hypothetical protein